MGSSHRVWCWFALMGKDVFLPAMALWHYFSKDEDKRARFIFDLIAPFYFLIDRGTQDHYRKMAALFNRQIPLKDKSVLDVGCGTGSWIATLKTFGLKTAAGVDFSAKMLREAEKNHPDIRWVHQRGENLSTFADHSFDVVTATFVLHGMKAPKRAKLLKEMQRVARRFVVIHDFYRGASFAVWLLETLERSDYVRFKKHFKDEMATFFPETEVLVGEKGNALYIGRVS